MSDKTVKRILENAGHLNTLLSQSGAVTHREVHALRNAFNKAMANTPKYEFSKKATQCDNLLAQLEAKVAADPSSHTGDKDVTFEAKLDEKWKFANIPKRRRLQTLCVSFLLFFTGLPFFLGLTYLLLTVSWYSCALTVAYLVYTFTLRIQHPLPKRKWFCEWGFFKQFRDYFPIRLVIDKSVRQKITPQRNYMFIYHPHGVHSFGAMAVFGADACGMANLLPGIKFHCQTLKINFLLPFWRELFILSGAGDASSATIRKTLSSGPGESIVLVVGGAEEALMSTPQTNKLTLGKRKGFIKIALETGSPLVPVYAFGENNVYNNLADGRPWLQRLQAKVQKKIGFALPLIHGRGYFNYHFGVLPHRRPIAVVVGAPLEVPKVDKSKLTQALIDDWHERYVVALKKVYSDNKDVYDLKSTDLNIVN